MENWQELIETARKAGFAVDDNGYNVEFKRDEDGIDMIGLFVKDTNPRAKVTGYQAACEWLQRRGVIL